MPNWRTLSLLAVLALISACGGGGNNSGSDQLRRVERTYDFAKAQFEAVNRNELAALSYQSALETGGTPVNYLVANMPPTNADFARIHWQEPPSAWSVLLKEGPGADDLVIEAYGESITQPLRSETLVLQPMAAP